MDDSITSSEVFARAKRWALDKLEERGPEGCDLDDLEFAFDLAWNADGRLVDGATMCGILIDEDLALYNGSRNRITAARYAGDCGDSCAL